MAHHLRVAGAFFVGRNRADERLVLRGEEVRRRAEDLRRAAAEDDVLGLDAVLLRDRVDELAAARRIAAGCAAAVAKRGAHRLQHRLAGPERVLVAGQADHARRDGLERRLERGPDAVLAAARADPRPGQRGRRRRCRPSERIRVATAPCVLLETRANRVVRVIRVTVALVPDRGRRHGPEHVSEHCRGLLHLFHRADRDARVGLFERREGAAHQDPLLRAGVAELLGGAPDCRRRGSWPASRWTCNPDRRAP